MHSIAQVDAFTDIPFAGNPAAVFLLEEPADDGWMQNAAREMNLSETAFVTPGDQHAHFGLRWFTPAVEVELCGHSTLASAHILFEEKRVGGADTIQFSTLSGPLRARRSEDGIVLDFPATVPEQSEPPHRLSTALGSPARSVARSGQDYIYELESEANVRVLEPDLSLLRQLPVRVLIVTAKSESSDFDFVSRVFAPSQGVDEDPVTGAAHCMLGPYWMNRLGKRQMTAFQASERGGVLGLELKGDRIELTGKAVTVLRGHLLA